MEDKTYLAALHSIGISQAILNKIFEQKQNYKNFYEKLDHKSLSKYYITQPAKIDFILGNKKEFDINHLEKQIKKFKTTIITKFDSTYPENLKNIFNPPFLFYLRGQISLPCIAFVGTRNITSYGKYTIEKFVPEVGKYFSIISGGAAGCDTHAHVIALENNIKTISIIGTGIDENYPASNKKLFEKIVDEGGSIISIFPFGEKGQPFNFPIRNEIVAGLSEGVVIIEAKERSGSLITARLGLELGKEVFAVPGDINKQYSAGCNKIISKGEAKMITDSQDILGEYNILQNTTNQQTKNIIFNDDEEKQIYNILLLEPLSTDEIFERISGDISYILLKLSMLELSGLIKKTNSGKYEVI